MTKENSTCRDVGAFLLGLLIALAFVCPLRSIPAKYYEPGSQGLIALFAFFSALSWNSERILVWASSAEPSVLLRCTLISLWGVQVFDSIAIAFVPSVYLHTGRSLIGLTALGQMAYLATGIGAHWIYPCKNKVKNYPARDALSLVIGALVSTAGAYVVAALPDACFVRGSKALGITFAALAVGAFAFVGLLHACIAPASSQRDVLRRSIHIAVSGGLLHQSIYFMFPSAGRMWGREGTALAVAGAGKIWTIANIGIATFVLIPDTVNKLKTRME